MSELNPSVSLSKANASDRTVNEHTKDQSLDHYRTAPGELLTTDDGHLVNTTDDSLKAGGRGPTLLEDFHFQEKLSNFDRERIPERVVHARGSGAHGYFQPYAAQTEFTKAKFLQNAETKTPVFVRFSTVGGSRGSADAVRDVPSAAVHSQPALRQRQAVSQAR